MYILTTMTKKRSISIRLHNETYNKLATAARADDRSMAMMTQVIINQFFNKKKAT